MTTPPQGPWKKSVPGRDDSKLDPCDMGFRIRANRELFENGRISETGMSGNSTIQASAADEPEDEYVLDEP